MHKKNTSKRKQVTKPTSRLPQKSRQTTLPTTHSRKQVLGHKIQQFVVLTTVVPLLAATLLAIMTRDANLLKNILRDATELAIAVIKAM